MVEIIERFPREVSTSSSVITPMEMLHSAISNGADIAILEKLMGLQERYEASQARKAFDSAMADAKAHMGTVHKTTKGNYRFNVDQTEKSMKVTCIVRHRDGHFEETTLMSPIDTSGSKNAVQQIGSTQSYLQRYSLMAALGLAASRDDDGHAAGIKTLTGQSVEGLIVEGRRIAVEEGIVGLGKWWTKELTAQQRKDVGTGVLAGLKALAQGEAQ
jgi:hypothetical protein